MIPKIIHQIWVGKNKLPPKNKLYIEDVKHHHPEYQHMLWTDDHLPPFPDGNFTEVYNHLGSKKDYAFQADMLRVLVVYLYGGFYLDVDFNCKKPLSMMPINSDLFLCTHIGDMESLTNSVFGARANHPLFSHCLQDMKQATVYRHWFGPSWFAQMLKEHFQTPLKITHEYFIAEYLNKRNVFNMNFDSDFQPNWFHHDSLASWFPENALKLEQGIYE